MELRKDNYQTLILQAGSVDITNLNTKDNPTNYIEYFRQETVMSARNLFSAAVNAIESGSSMQKIIIMKHIPRYDASNVDPLALKSTLSMLFNDTLTDLWMVSPHKEKIFIGNHNIDCSGAIRESRYRHTKSGKYDGIHLYGSSGSKAYTSSVLNILQAAEVTSSDYNYHTSCPQFKYQNRRIRLSTRHQPSQPRHWVPTLLGKEVTMVDALHTTRISLLSSQHLTHFQG